MNGEIILQIAAQRIGDQYVYGAFVPKDDPYWAGPWDCAEFASWLVYQAAGFLYGCENNYGNPATAQAYTGYWQRDAEMLGQSVDWQVAAQTPGAFLLRFPQPSGHIAISDGMGGTVEAHSQNVGVAQRLVDGRRWDVGVLVPGIAYTTGAGPIDFAPFSSVIRLTYPLTIGEKVEEIQYRLNDAGFDPGVIDGEYGQDTARAVSAFQAANGLLVDGEVGAETAAALGMELV